MRTRRQPPTGGRGVGVEWGYKGYSMPSEVLIMARTESAMLALGTSAPAFAAQRCPHQRRPHQRLAHRPQGPARHVHLLPLSLRQARRAAARRARLDFRKSGVGFVAISSNDAENYPDDAPSSLAEQALKLGFLFPYLYDETQEVARAYDAACTPTSSSRLHRQARPTAASSTPAVPATTSPSRVAISAPPSGRYCR